MIGKKACPPSRRIETVLPFVLIAAAVAVAVFFAMRGPVARSEEGNDSDGVDYGEYGIPPGEIKERALATPIFGDCKPMIPLKDLPPMPPLFGPQPERPPEKPVEEMTPEELEKHKKIEWLKNRKFPWDKKEEE